MQSIQPCKATLSKQFNDAYFLFRLQEFKKMYPKNKRCANCGDLGPTFVCMDFGTLVCTICAGIHREMSHRVKGIMLSKWNEDELRFILEHGNVVDEQVYYTQLPLASGRPSPGNVERLRTWIKEKYIEKKWTAQNALSMQEQPKPSELNGIHNSLIEATPVKHFAPKPLIPKSNHETSHLNNQDQLSTTQKSPSLLDLNTINRDLGPPVNFFDFPELPPEIFTPVLLDQSTHHQNAKMRNDPFDSVTQVQHHEQSDLQPSLKNPETSRPNDTVSKDFISGDLKQSSPNAAPFCKTLPFATSERDLLHECFSFKEEPSQLVFKTVQESVSNPIKDDHQNNFNTLMYLLDQVHVTEGAKPLESCFSELAISFNKTSPKKSSPPDHFTSSDLSLPVSIFKTDPT